MRGGGDTIVAIATPPGAAAIGVVRLSGTRARACVRPILRLVSGDLDSIRPRTLHRTAVVDPVTGAEIDQAMVAVMPAPRSYTGEDVVEISCHGNPVLLGDVVRKLVATGARLAEPGEFTRRAYLNGRLDLIQAEAVALLIGARSERAALLAAREMVGGLSGKIRELRERALDLVAGLEVALDFPDDEVGLPRTLARDGARDLAGRLGDLLGQARRGRIYHHGLDVMLVGAPNTGKSSILNRLLGVNRAIVSPIPGTTRDIVDGILMLEQVAIRLADGAGVGTPKDAIDAEGMVRTRSEIERSDVVLVVLDRSRAISAADRDVLGLTQHRERLLVANKSDLPAAWSDLSVDCVCSALTGSGIESVQGRLGRWIKERVVADADEGGVVASMRVVDQLERARSAFERSAEGLALGAAIEIALIDLHTALVSLGETLGLRTDDAVLDRIFSTFCVGK